MEYGIRRTRESPPLSVEITSTFPPSSSIKTGRQNRAVWSVFTMGASAWTGQRREGDQINKKVRHVNGLHRFIHRMGKTVEAFDHLLPPFNLRADPLGYPPEPLELRRSSPVRNPEGILPETGKLSDNGHDIVDLVRKTCRNTPEECQALFP